MVSTFHHSKTLRRKQKTTKLTQTAGTCSLPVLLRSGGLRVHDLEGARVAQRPSGAHKLPHLRHASGDREGYRSRLVHRAVLHADLRSQHYFWLVR